MPKSSMSTSPSPSRSASWQAAATGTCERVRQAALASSINLRYRADGTVGVALDETTGVDDVAALVAVFGAGQGRAVVSL